MSDLDPFELDLRALSREMRTIVDEVGKDTIAGDYHNPFKVRVDPLFVVHEAELGEDVAKARVYRTQLPRDAYSVKDFERVKRRQERRPRPPGKISPGLRDEMQRAGRGPCSRSSSRLPSMMVFVFRCFRTSRRRRSASGGFRSLRR